MRKTVTILVSLLFAASAFAQNAGDEFKASYERQVRNVGYAGVGVETIINRWEAADPDDPYMLLAKHNFNLIKAQSTQVVVKDKRRYLGMEPVLSLKDSLDKDVYYFQEVVYDDDLYAEAIRAIDRAISINDLELRYILSKITALVSYEKESPDMAAAELTAFIDRYAATKDRPWTLDGERVGEDVFLQAVGEYCYSFFQTASDASYDYFFKISQKMSKLYPKDVVFINNQGAYWQAAKKDNKKALRFYKKAIKLDPDDYAANRNIKLIESSQSKKGRSSK